MSKATAAHFVRSNRTTYDAAVRSDKLSKLRSETKQ